MSPTLRYGCHGTRSGTPCSQTTAIVMTWKGFARFGRRHPMPDKSISELWNEMSDILGTIPKYEDYPLLYARPMREANERLNTLRATLLEQCISEYGLKIQADAFE